MATQNEQKRILKFHLPANRSNGRYSLPESNHYFAKVLPNSKLISESFNQSMEKHQLKSSQARSMMRSISLSLSMSRKISRDQGHQLKNAISLPKIGQKSLIVFNQNSSEITRSELGCFNVYEILKQRQDSEPKLKKKQEDERQANAGQQDLDLEKQDEKVNEQKQYDYYDALLMMKEPKIQRTKHFRLKHKAEWRLSLAR